MLKSNRKGYKSIKIYFYKIEIENLIRSCLDNQIIIKNTKISKIINTWFA